MTEEVRVSLVTAACVLGLAVLSRWFLASPLDFVAQFAPIWLYVPYLATRGRKAGSEPRGSALAWSALIIVITVAVAVVSFL